LFFKFVFSIPVTMAATLWRLYSKSICNSLQGIILNKPFIQKQLLLSSRTRSLSFSSDSQFGSATAEVCSNTGEFSFGFPA